MRRLKYYGKSLVDLLGLKHKWTPVTSKFDAGRPGDYGLEIFRTDAEVLRHGLDKRIAIHKLIISLRKGTLEGTLEGKTYDTTFSWYKYYPLDGYMWLGCTAYLSSGEFVGGSVNGKECKTLDEFKKATNHYFHLKDFSKLSHFIKHSNLPGNYKNAVKELWA